MTTTGDSATATTPAIDDTATVDTSAHKQTPVDEANATPLASKQPKKKRRIWRWLALLGFIIFIFFVWKNYRTLDDRTQTSLKPTVTEPERSAESQDNNSKINAHLSTLNQALDNLKQQVAAQDSSPWQSALLDLQQQQQQLLQNYRYLYQQQRHLGDKTDWFLAETGYLLRVAQQRLYLEQDLLSAIKALETANVRLAQSDDPHLLPLRDAIIQDLHRLQAVPIADIQGIALALLDYSRQAQKLPLVQGVTQLVEQQQSPDIINEGEKTWRDYLADIGEKLQGLIVVRYNANHQAAVLSPEQRFFVQQNLQLKLASARLLLLSKDEQGFRAALKDLLSWLADYYDQSNNAVQALTKHLSDWQNQPLIPEQLDLSLSLQQFKRLNALAHYSSQAPQVLGIAQ